MPQSAVHRHRLRAKLHDHLIPSVAALRDEIHLFPLGAIVPDGLCQSIQRLPPDVRSCNPVPVQEAVNFIHRGGNQQQPAQGKQRQLFFPLGKGQESAKEQRETYADVGDIHIAVVGRQI